MSFRTSQLGGVGSEEKSYKSDWLICFSDKFSHLPECTSPTRRFEMTWLS